MSVRSDIPLVLAVLLALLCEVLAPIAFAAERQTGSSAPANREPLASIAPTDHASASRASVGHTSADHAAGSHKPAARTDVYVLSTLYKRHETTPAYDLAALRRIVLAIAPELVVVDCTPNEVKTRKVSPGKIEYPAVIFPLAEAARYPIVPAEPDEPRFTEIVTRVSAVRKDVAATQPALAAALDAYDASTYAVLAQHWQSPAAVHDEVTEAALRGLSALEREFYGRADGDAQTEWNRHWTAAILDAVAAHPGKRILAVTGVENRPWIVDALRQDPRVNVVDMPAWLRAHAATPAVASAPAAR